MPGERPDIRSQPAAKRDRTYAVAYAKRLLRLRQRGRDYLLSLIFRRRRKMSDKKQRTYRSTEGENHA